jgi:hypothetical protein
MTKYPLVRTIYLYLFALVGLTLLTIGAVRFVYMGLKVFVFTKADQQQAIYNKMPPVAPLSIEKLNQISQQPVNTGLTADEKAQVEAWLVQYKDWQEQNKNFDAIVSQRQNEASMNLALMLVGVPLYLFHWRLIKKDTRAKELAEKKNE